MARSTTRFRHAIVTGASSGIGAAIAERLGREGVALTLVARRAAPMERLAKRLGGADTRCRVQVADLATRDLDLGWVQAAEAALGPCDLLINNAGAQYVEAALGVSAERAERIFRVNVLAPMQLAGVVAATMIVRGAGAVANIASMAAVTPTPGMAHYSATKSALAAWSETLRVELAPSGVHVCTVYPGPVTTPMEQAARVQLNSGAIAGRLPTGTSAELAEQLLAALAHQRPRLFYPRIYELSRYVPALALAITQRLTPGLRGA